MSVHRYLYWERGSFSTVCFAPELTEDLLEDCRQGYTFILDLRDETWYDGGAWHRVGEPLLARFSSLQLEPTSKFGARRLGVDAYFACLARVTALRSTCPRRQVGAVLVAEKKVVATGYNGASPGLPHCLDVGCLLHEGRCVRTTHAELNALLQVRVTADTLYCTDQPCLTCYKALLNHGVRRVVFDRPYLDEARDRFVQEHVLEHELAVMWEASGVLTPGEYELYGSLPRLDGD